jgi:hypothetical protein
VATTGPNVRPGEKPPVRPELATRNSRAGAAEFARYWFAALDWGYATTDSTLAKTLYLPACIDCARFIKIFDVARSKGEHFRGGRSAVIETLLASNDSRHPDATPVDVTIRVAALDTLRSDESVVVSAPAIPKLTSRIWLKWLGERWAVLDTKRVVRR